MNVSYWRGAVFFTFKAPRSQGWRIAASSSVTVWDLLSFCSGFWAYNKMPFSLHLTCFVISIALLCKLLQRARHIYCSCSLFHDEFFIPKSFCSGASLNCLKNLFTAECTGLHSLFWTLNHSDISHVGEAVELLKKIFIRKPSFVMKSKLHNTHGVSKCMLHFIQISFV